MRLPRVVAGASLIGALALIALPGVAGSRNPGADRPFDPDLLRTLEVPAAGSGKAVTTPTLDPAYRSDGAIDGPTTLLEPAAAPDVRARPAAAPPRAPVGIVVIPRWHYDPDVSWYGPGLYGNGTACGPVLTRDLMGVAHRTLPCGTRVTFKNPANGRVVTVPVVDRGPYVAGRQWDLTAAACGAIGHCYTGPIYWKLP